MSTRPLERLPTIRGKLGSTIVVAVAITIVISYGLIGFALRNSPKDSEAVDALSLARRVQLGAVDPLPANTMVARRDRFGIITIQGADLGVTPPMFDDFVPHWGVVGKNVYAFLPLGGEVPRSPCCTRRPHAGRWVGSRPRSGSSRASGGSSCWRGPSRR